MDKLTIKNSPSGDDRLCKICVDNVDNVAFYEKTVTFTGVSGLNVTVDIFLTIIDKNVFKMWKKWIVSFAEKMIAYFIYISGTHCYQQITLSAIFQQIFLNFFK